MAQWIIVIIAICGLIYNTIVTYTILRNDVKHLKEDNKEIKKDLRQLRKSIIEAIIKAMAKGDCEQIEKLEQELFGIDEDKGD